MEYVQITGKNVDDAINNALIQLGTTSDKLDYKIIEKGTSGFLGIGSKPAVIEARKVVTVEDKAVDFLNDILSSMDMEVKIDTQYDIEKNSLDIDMSGNDMGILIGKRGQTLDALQYLTSLVVNKDTDDYIRVKLDTENYRERRREALESLAKNIAAKVKRTRRSVSLEPMNPFERRVIHSTLQSDRYVFTRSEGEEPFRHVVVCLKREKNNK